MEYLIASGIVLFILWRRSKAKKQRPIKLKSSDSDAIESFLSDYPVHVEGAAARKAGSAAVNSSSPSSPGYYQPEITKETKAKIKRIKGITKSIEKRFSPPPKEISLVTKNGKIDYKNELNSEQLYVVATTDGPLLVIAGAGTGKTRTLTYRVCYLLEGGVPPEKILLLTFTRKAASEMTERVKELLGDDSKTEIAGGTFHALANTVMRRYAKILGIQPNFSIIDTIDSQDIIALIRREQKFQKGERAFPRKNRIQAIISKSRNCRISIQQVIENEYSGLLEYSADIELIFKMYSEYKRIHQLFDYDDLIDFFVQSLKDIPSFREIMQNKYSFIMVDEYQDTNIPQKELVELLAAQHKNVMIVGDDSQSIYSFRGANFENILLFPETYPDCTTIKLEQNYRSTQRLLDFSNSIIDHSIIGYRKKLRSSLQGSARPVVAKFADSESEAKYVVDQIIKTSESGVKHSEIAVLYRASMHSNTIQLELTKRSIPYVVFGGIKFVERRHVRDVIALLRIASNPVDATSWNRLLTMLDGIGNVTAKRIIQSVSSGAGTIDFSEHLKKKFYPDLNKLGITIKSISDERVSVRQKLKIITDYYSPILKDLESDYQKRLLDIDLLETLAGDYDKLDKFLSDFALDPPSNQFQDSSAPRINETEEPPVTLSTIHSSKGLEWHTVLVPHLLDGVFPSERSMTDIESLEEERRLFYVATSRAKSQLHLTMPSYMSSWDSFFTLPSRHLIEVDGKLWDEA